jgi:hypothetical protein
VADVAVVAGSATCGVRTGPPAAAARRASSGRACAEPTSPAELARLGRFLSCSLYPVSSWRYGPFVCMDERAGQIHTVQGMGLFG